MDLVSVRENLTKTLSSSYKPHAYLFSGPKGTGKTSAARIVAKILNCSVTFPKLAKAEKVKDSGIEPCNECESCVAITEGRHLDVIEIDAASNRGIDEIRDLRDKIRLAPAGGRNKIYIIDEVHMLTNDAFNALLKTLEEPPEHTVFILATTEPEKLPETILSRSSKFVFNKANRDEILHALKRVVKGEKIKIDDSSLSLIAEHADGSFRDATKFLEQAVNKKLSSLADVSGMLGWDSIFPEKFLVDLKKNRVNKLLQTIVAMGQRGTDFRFFTAEILNLLHKLLLCVNGIEQTDLSPDLQDMFANQEINQLIKLFSQVYADLKYASRPELPLETAVVEWCQGKEIKNV